MNTYYCICDRFDKINLHIITENELSKLYHEMISDREFNHSFLVEIKGLYKWMK